MLKPVNNRGFLTVGSNCAAPPVEAASLKLISETYRPVHARLDSCIVVVKDLPNVVPLQGRKLEDKVMNLRRDDQSLLGYYQSRLSEYCLPSSRQLRLQPAR